MTESSNTVLSAWVALLLLTDFRDLCMHVHVHTRVTNVSPAAATVHVMRLTCEATATTHGVHDGGDDLRSAVRLG